ncbi:MAG: ubiquinone biosynthesis protein UbiJ [Bermanella sp.]|jgi:ubiquinone biosynthesis protein UbiJ
MYEAQVMTAAVEFAINKILSFDEDSHVLLQPLVGKQCEIKLHELPFPLVFNFHATRVEVSSLSSSLPSPLSGPLSGPLSNHASEQVAAQKKHQKSHNYCAISLSIFIISELKDTSNITRLIRENKLDFDGDLQIARNMSELFVGLNIDIEEILSKHLGDIAAHNAMQGAESFGQFIKSKHTLAMQALSHVLLDEKPIGVRPIMLENYIQEVSEVRDTAARLEARLAILENKARKKQK